MVWYTCKTPTIKEGRLRLRKNEKCLKCGKQIRKFYKTQSGQILELRIANDFHECQGCGAGIERGEAYFGITVKTDDFLFPEKYTWALCLNCYPRRGI
ncbi:MAG: hypothetical protein ACE5J4_02790 [Candidatus Aenigmatarchaeota archaeon]